MRGSLAAILALALGSSACIRSSNEFACTLDSECGTGGTCEVALGGFCSVSDTTCDSGRRFSERAGERSSDCVDPAAPSAPAFAGEAHATSSNATLAYALTVPAGDKRYLIVSVALSGDCTNASPVTTSVTYGGAALQRIAVVSGTPVCPANLNSTRSEQWALVAPPTGQATVTVTLAAPAVSFHSGALVFTGVNQTAPVRRTQAASGGNATETVVAIESAAGDLVVNTTGAGAPFNSPRSADTQRYLSNVDDRFTLNNSAASTAPGAAVVTTSWGISAPDEWQSISTSLQP